MRKKGNKYKDCIIKIEIKTYYDTNYEFRNLDSFSEKNKI